MCPTKIGWLSDFSGLLFFPCFLFWFVFALCHVSIKCQTRECHAVFIPMVSMGFVVFCVLVDNKGLHCGGFLGYMSGIYMGHIDREYIYSILESNVKPRRPETETTTTTTTTVIATSTRILTTATATNWKLEFEFTSQHSAKGVKNRNNYSCCLHPYPIFDRNTFLENVLYI